MSTCPPCGFEGAYVRALCAKCGGTGQSEEPSPFGWVRVMVALVVFCLGSYVSVTVVSGSYFEIGGNMIHEPWFEFFTPTALVGGFLIARRVDRVVAQKQEFFDRAVGLDRDLPSEKEYCEVEAPYLGNQTGVEDREEPHA